MSSTFIEHSPEGDTDKSLILIMDSEGNVTADPAQFEKLINNQKLPDMGIKIVRLDSGQAENGNDGNSENKQELKLTVEEIYPESLALTPGDPSGGVMNSSLEILPGPSNEHISHDIVDPFSQMDPEQLQRLEHALASEQAKQILGENVAAMLDMLSVDDSPAAFLQNSIRNDHCYTNLLPSSDPNGPSFYTADSKVASNGETSKGKGKAKVGTPMKGRKIVSSGTIIGGNLVKGAVIKDGQFITKQVHNKASVVDYGQQIVGVSQLKSQEDVDDPSYEVDVDGDDSEGSVGVEDDNLSDEDYSNRSTRTKKRPQKSRKRLVVRKQGRAMGRPVAKGGSRMDKFIASDIRARNEKLNDAMSKVVQSMKLDANDGGGGGDDDDDDGLTFKRGLKKLKPKVVKKIVAVEAGERVVKEVSKVVVEEVSPQEKQQPAKYPKRENRKPPAHLAEAFGPALFSAPDIIRRISTGDEVPQTPPEKKNFTVGVHSNPKTPVTPQKTTPVKAADTTTPRVDKAKVKPVQMVKEVSKVADADDKDGTVSNLQPVLGQSHVKAGAPPAVVSDGGVVGKKANLEIQKLIEKHQVKQPLYDEDQDFSDENIDENYYLDPTQMDQSLLEGFAQTATKSEDQLLQEAILLQEQLIESNKSIILPEADGASLDETPVELPFETETIEDIQKEITSAILVASQDGRPESKSVTVQQFAQGSIKAVQAPIPAVETTKDQSQSQNEQTGMDNDEGDSSMVIDESKPEERRRISAKRRRSDEVSDLDSDLDDALSEASWNSEDDPDRLWCICRKPHNNRFMICCDVCEEWFHGKCVGITKTIGRQMEQDGLEWSCPNCTKKKKAEEYDRESEKIKLLKEKMLQAKREQQQKLKDPQKAKAQALGGKDKGLKSPKSSSNLKQTKISDFSQPVGQGSGEEETFARKCIMCKGPVRENSIYCSDDCIRKHSQHAISQLMADGAKKGSGDSPGGGDNLKPGQKIPKEASRIVVMDSNSKKFLVGQNAPTAANLTTWLKENPSYQVVYKKSDKPGKILLTSRKVVKIHSKPGEPQKVFVQAQKVSDSVKSTQLKLAVSPNSKQINILQPAGSGGSIKKIFQIINSPGVAGKQTAFVVKSKQAEVIEALPLPVKTVVTKGGLVKDGTKVTAGVGIAGSAGSSKEAAGQKPEKVPRRRKEKTQKTIPSVLGGKDMKAGQKQEEVKDKDKDKKEADQQIRESVKKTLAETLKARVQECKDMQYNEEHIDGLALKIEEKLFKHFENKVDTKYKSKYRSLVFNIKDPKNETLYKKIVDNLISPKELVKLSPDELASQELARWREKENQHQLEIIKKTELELMTKGNTYIMKSHKGEQVIESGEKVATVAAEIDPNTPAQELVSALNSVTSTTQDVNDEAATDKGKRDSDASLSKLKKRERERKRSRDRKHDRRDKERRRSSSRSRSHRSKDKKRSRSRDRDKYRHKDKDKDKKSEVKKEKSSKEGQDVAEEKSEGKSEKGDISTSEVSEEKATKKVVEDDEADREPSSTVIIKTPDINVEEPEPVPLWKGSIVMADVAKFSGIALEISGCCSGLSYDLGEKVDVVGRIPFATVWDYIARMKKMGTKDILVIKILPGTEEEKASYVTLYSYLSKRARIGVIGKTSDAVKDFYLYPLASHSPLPAVLLPLEGQTFEGERDNIILGIIVRNKHRNRYLAAAAASGEHVSKTLKKPTSAGVDEDVSSETVPDRSYTPPLPDKDHDNLLKKDRQKRKIRVRMEYKDKPANDEDEDMIVDEDDDSPYSPGDSDDDLPPLPKIAKPTAPSLSTSISKLLSPGITSAVDSNLQDPNEIQRKIEEMNRAIEEQTQQIQNLTSTVPKLAAGVVLPTLPLLANVTSAMLNPVLSPSASVPVPANFGALPSVPSPIPTEKVQLPLISSDNEESNGGARSFTPPLKVEENIPFLPEVTSKISLPSNLQEILNSIQKKSEEPEKSAEDIVKTNNPDIDLALNVLNQTKSLLSSFTSLSSGSGPAVEATADSSLGPLPESSRKDPDPGPEYASVKTSSNVPDIPLLPTNGPFANPPPPPFFANPPPPSPPDQVAPFEPKSGAKAEKRPKLDPKSVFESEGVPDFLNFPTSSWDPKKGTKPKNYKIDIKLAMNTLERKAIDSDHFDIESITKVAGLGQQPQQPQPNLLQASTSGSNPMNPLISRQVEDPSKFDVDERDKYRGGVGVGGPPAGTGAYDRDERRSNDDRDTKRDTWKYDRRHWDDGRRFKDDYRRHGGGGGGPGRRGDRPGKFKKDRFDDKRNRHGPKDWDGNGKGFNEDRPRWRNQDGRRDDMRKSRKRADSN